MYRLGRNGDLELIDESDNFERTQCYLDYLQINLTEAEILTGESDSFISAEMIADSIAEHCAITLGNEGCLFYDGNEFITVPAHATSAVDLYGAGAVHLAAFVSGLLKDKSLFESLSLAGAAASIKTEQVGLLFSLDEEELLGRTQSLMVTVRSS